jgi:hypothetical protein
VAQKQGLTERGKRGRPEKNEGSYFSTCAQIQVDTNIVLVVYSSYYFGKHRSGSKPAFRHCPELPTGGV